MSKDTSHARRLARAFAASLAACLLVSCVSPRPAGSPVTADILLGTWTVDLRPTPAAEPYFQEFVVTAVAGSTFSGSFYGAPVSEARINTDWGKLRIAFTTADASGAYHHSAVLDGDTLEGLTNSMGRGFLAYWSAVKP